MRVNITANTCTIDNNVYLNAGEYNINKFYFTFSEEYLDKYVKKALFIDKDGTPIEMVIANNECDIPYDILKNPGTYTFGVYAYEMNDTELVLRYSPEPTHFYVNKGSYIEDGISPTEPTPDEFAQYYQAMQDLIANAKPELIDYIEDNLPTVDIGETSTLEPGSEATVINVGTDRNPVFVFGIPKGDPGTTDYNELENRPDLSVYALIRESANKITLDIDNETFKMKAKIFDKNNNLISESNIIDLPLESVVVSGEYDSQTQKLILTLENGNTIEVPLSGLVSGLVSEEELTNRLNTAIKIETISKNGTRVPIYNKNVDISVPSSTNELINNSGFITKDVANLTHYYDKAASDTRYPLVGESANNLIMDLDNTTYVLTATLKDRNGRAISVQRITFPFESIFTSISNLSSTKADVTDLTAETLARQNADTGLQNQIDAITSASDVVDVVSTYSDLSNYDTTKLTDKDVIKVMQDENHNNAISYYRWDESNEEFSYIGSEGPFYTKGETDTLLNGKVDNSTLDNYVQFTDVPTTTKSGAIKDAGISLGYSITQTGANAGKLEARIFTYGPYQNSLYTNGFVGKGTLENVITGKNLETANNKVTTIDENSTDTQYPSAKCVYDSQITQDNEIDTLKMIYNILPTDTDTGETISIDNTGEMSIKSTSLGGNTSQVVIPAESGTNVNATSISINDVNTDKEHTIAIDGDTYQKTTNGENLLPTDLAIEQTSNGVKITPLGNGQFRLNGTASSLTEFWIQSYNYSATTEILKSGVTYYVKTFFDGTHTRGVLSSLWNGSNYEFQISESDNYNGYAYTPSTDIVQKGYKIVIPSGAQYINCIVSSEIAKINPTSWDEYSGGQPSPNPDYQQDIEVVTGKNDITICGKNLWKFNGTTFNGWAVQNNDILKFFNSLKEGTYTLVLKAKITSLTNPQERYRWGIFSDNFSGNLEFRSYVDDEVNVGDIISSTFTFTISSAQKGQFMHGYTYTLSNTMGVKAGDIELFETQLEKGSTATTYEPYVSQTYPVSLSSRNILSLPNISNTMNGVTVTTYSDGRIIINGTATGVVNIINFIIPNPIYYSENEQYTFSIKYISGSATNLNSTNGITIKKGTVGQTDYGDIASLQIQNDYSSNKNVSITTSDNNSMTRVQFIGLYTEQTYNNLTYKLQIEKGTTATEFTPYQDPIELCKIDTYKDRIYKSNDKWYLEKQIGKVVLNGSENWSYESSETTPTNRTICRFNIPTAAISTNYYCDKFLYNSTSSNRIVFIANNQRPYFSIENRIVDINSDDTNNEKLAKIIEYVSSNNILIYYVSNTPTTEITDSTLVSQLNALSNSTLYSTTNINTATSNLLPYIDLQYNVVTPSPSPNKPSVVNVVKGENTLTICGKNLFDEIYPNLSSTLQYMPIFVGDGTFTMSSSTPYNSSGASVFLLAGNVNTGASSNTNGVYTSHPITQTSINGYLTIAYRNFDNIDNYKTQLEKSSTASAYEPYKSQTYPINLPSGLELCKISTHQDYFYKDNDNWYKRNVIKKVVLDENTYFGYQNGCFTFTPGDVKQTDAATEILVMSDYYKGVTTNYRDGISNNCIAKVIGSSNQQIGIKDNRYTTTSELQTWLSTHNTIVYYALETPTNTQITDTTLITQLDNLQKAISYDSQTNISQTNEDKSFIITAEMFLSLKSIFD